MSKNITKGMFRVWVVVAVLWVGGMGGYQYQDAKEYKDSGITISLSKDSQFRIGEDGISSSRESDRSELKMKRIGMVFIPPIVLLMVFPIGMWLIRGFKGK